MNREIRKFVKFDTMKYLPRPILASIIMGVVLLVVYQWHTIFLVILGIFIYILVLYLLKGFSKKELKDLRKVIIQK
jgi:ABC-type bacteriocin/lantibiotic exporter with double-glycine peptidase domain